MGNSANLVHGYGYGNSTAQCERTLGQAPAPKTIGEVFDQRIEQARKTVERLCVQKAKLEALQMLNHPYVEMRDLINGDPF